MLTNFLVNSALMAAMLVKLLLFLIASKTSSVSSLKVSFSSSKYALCYKIFFFNSFTFLFFSFFLRDCQYFQMRDANFLSRVILVVVSSFEAFWNSSWSTFTHSKLPKNITTCHLQRVLEYGLPCKGLFTFCRCINDNKFAAEFKVSLYSGEAGLTLTNVIAAHSTIHACDEFRDFWHAPHFSFLRRLFSYTTGILFLCLTTSVFAVVQGDAIWIHLVLLQKADH